MAKRGRKTRPAIIRFLEKIRVSQTRSFEGTPCWIWAGGYDSSTGYPGAFRIVDTNDRPYRFAYMYFTGEIPPQMEVHHRCYHPPCCNPLHLGLLTHRENVLDGNAPTAKHLRKTHCPQGHPYSGENLRMCKTSRYCRACAADYRRQHKERHPNYWAEYRAKQKARTS